MHYQVIVVGAGLAGLLSGILLKKAGLEVLVMEKSTFPFHRVCGEYISHEVSSFLKSQDLYPHHLSPSLIDTLLLSSASGHYSKLKLPLGGFGISRYTLDYFWYKKALECGVTVKEKARVSEINFDQGAHRVILDSGHQFNSEIVVGSFGKRSKLDRKLLRPFFTHRSPYVGVKYHMVSPWEEGVIALHAFEGGYCGISQIEDNKINLCYLVHRDQLKRHGDVEKLEHGVLKRNPHLNEVFKGAQLLFEKPLVINEVSFSAKKSVVNHILMAGDAAGMIAPLCGNGMAMAIRSAYLLSPLIVRYFSDKKFKRADLESSYHQIWSSNFAYRLKLGRQLQKAFHWNQSMRFLVRLARWEAAGRWLVAQTHGSEIPHTGNY